MASRRFRATREGRAAHFQEYTEQSRTAEGTYLDGCLTEFTLREAL